MKNKDSDFIDKLAQDALENFEVEFDPMDWVDMQSKLSAESNIDKIAKDALKDHEVPFDVRDWKRLEKQLDKKDHLYPAIWWMKSAEVGMVALLIFTIFNLSTNNNKNETLQPNQNYDNTTTLTPSSSDSNQNNANTQSDDTYKINEKEAQPKTTDENQVQAMLITNENSEVDNTSADNNNYSTTTKNNNSTKNNVNKTSTVATSVTDNTDKSNNNKNYTSIVSTTEENGNEVPNQTGNSFTGEDGTANNSIVSTTDNNNNSLTLNSSNLDNRTGNFATTIKEKNNVPQNNKNLTLTRSKFSILEITTLDAKNLGALKQKTTDPLFELKKLKLDLPYHCKTFVGGVVAIGANFANSMGGTSIGYGAGFVMASELSARIALKSGLLFAFRKHELKENYTLQSVDGSNSYEVEKTKVSNLVIVEMPLDFQYTFFKNEKWKIYATTGISANLIGSRTYTGSQKTTNQGLSVSTDINSDDYERGLFEGGQFTNNVFLSLGGGVGLERQLGDKISLYLLPTYRHAITPIATDFMSSFSINIGVKSSL